jgi:hypothetical protein
MNDMASMRKMYSVAEELGLPVLTDAVAVAAEVAVESAASDFFRGDKKIF